MIHPLSHLKVIAPAYTEQPVIISFVAVFFFRDFSPVHHTHIQRGTRPVQFVFNRPAVRMIDLPVGDTFHNFFCFFSQVVIPPPGRKGRKQQAYINQCSFHRFFLLSQKIVLYKNKNEKTPTQVTAYDSVQHFILSDELCTLFGRK